MSDLKDDVERLKKKIEEQTFQNSKADARS